MEFSKLATPQFQFFSGVQQQKCSKSLFSHSATRAWGQMSLAQVLACCLIAPSHCLMQCRLIISELMWHSPEDSFIGYDRDIIFWNAIPFELKTYLAPRGQWVNFVKLSAIHFCVIFYAQYLTFRKLCETVRHISYTLAKLDICCFLLNSCKVIRMVSEISRNLMALQKLF